MISEFDEVHEILSNLMDDMAIFRPAVARFFLNLLKARTNSRLVTNYTSWIEYFVENIIKVNDKTSTSLRFKNIFLLLLKLEGEEAKKLHNYLGSFLPCDDNSIENFLVRKLDVITGPQIVNEDYIYAGIFTLLLVDIGTSRSNNLENFRINNPHVKFIEIIETVKLFYSDKGVAIEELRIVPSHFISMSDKTIQLTQAYEHGDVVVTISPIC